MCKGWGREFLKRSLIFRICTHRMFENIGKFIFHLSREDGKIAEIAEQ